MRLFIDKLRAGLAACGAPQERLLIAISGGADSLALLRGLLSLETERPRELVAAHLDHGLRGEQSQADAAWVGARCRELGVPCAIGHENLAEFARSEGLGLEEAGRRLRYRFLVNEAERAGCGLVAVAHTADDQAETILHHIARGTGLAGLRGMPRRRHLSDRVELIRPLLDVRRADVRAWLAEIGQDFREDPTNVDERFTRNRIRHVLLPLLEREFNPDAAGAVLRLGRQAAEAGEALAVLARRLLEAAVLDRNATTCRVDCRPLADQPRFLIREAFRLLWADLDWPRQAMGYAEWERLADLATGDNAAATLPGAILAVRRGELLALSR
ncbi:MAG TPA: tRNA lysidine(34) synthetase TilS [Planctomycetaceae bacterium]|nr:tRNA lysidine(34) synthetase TilS [Planctomycetaceae bacterium]